MLLKVSWNKGTTGVFKHSEESKAKMAAAQIGRKRPKELVDRIAEKLRGRKLSPEHRAKLCEKRKGKKPTLGMKFSEETKKKMSDAQKSIGNKPPSSKGRKYSDEARKRMSETRKKLAPLLNKRGSESPNWKGGISPENKRIRSSPEFKEWRGAVFLRDDWTCQKCLSRGVTLHAHHIKEFSKYPELRFEVSNGLTLCALCHMELHGLDKKPPTTLRTKDGSIVDVPPSGVAKKTKIGMHPFTDQTSSDIVSFDIAFESFSG